MAIPTRCTRRSTRLATGSALAASLALLAGCGGGSNGGSAATGARSGRLTLKVVWPAAGKLIPAASNSIKASLSGASAPAPQIIARPTTGNTASVTFTELPAGSVTLTATAFPNADGSGVAQATGSAPATIVAGQTATVTVTMDSTVDHLSISPANPSVGVGVTQPLTMTAFDASNNVVLVAPANISWQSGTPANATVDGSGIVTGVAVGPSVITVKESESGKTATTAVTVAAAAPSFQINAGDTDTVLAGVGTGFDYTVQSVNGFAGTVTLSTTGAPADWTVQVSPSVNLTANGTASDTIQIQTTTGTAPGTYTINIVGTSGAITKKGTETVVISPPPATGARPLDVSVGPDGKIYYVVDSPDSQLVRMDDMAGTNLVAFGTQGSGVNQFFAPSQIAFDAQGRIYICDHGNSRIVRINDMTGAGWTTFGTTGSGVGQFFNPFGVAVDKNGRIYVVDPNLNRVARFDDMSGTNWTTFGSSGSGTGQFNSPRLIAVDANLRIYVTDTNNSRLVRMDDMAGTNFTALGTAGTGVKQFISPEAVALDGSGHIYVTDAEGTTRTPRVVRFDDMTGTNWTTFGTAGTGVGQFSEPRGIHVDASGHIYVADLSGLANGFGRIDRFDDMRGTNFVSFAAPQGRAAKLPSGRRAAPARGSRAGAVRLERRPGG